MLSLTLTLAWLAGAAPVLAEVPAAAGALGLRVGGLARVLDHGAPDPDPAYLPDERAVNNWRREAADDLFPASVAGAAARLDVGRPVVTRCVKLNNYWCIKRARWNGEIGADEEGHVGFATADHGADAAVTLLRRYYRDYGRRSALDVVRRWAPAECRTLMAGGSGAGMGGLGPGGAGLIGAGAPLALRGIQFTLRARWLSGRFAPVRAPRPDRTKLASVSTGTAVASTSDAGAVNTASPPSTSAPAPGSPAAAKPAPAPRPAASAKPQRQPARPVAARRGGARVSVIPLRPLPAFRVTGIMARMGEPSAAPTPALAPAPSRAATKPVAVRSMAGGTRSALATRPAARVAPRAAVAVPAKASAAAKPATVAGATLPLMVAAAGTPVATAAALPAAPPRPVTTCAPDEDRIQNYAARIVRDLGGLGPSDDLKLFDEDGRPLPNLVTVLLAMSSVELGVLRASADLVQGAVERAALRVAAADAESSSGTPAADGPPAHPETR